MPLVAFSSSLPGRALLADALSGLATVQTFAHSEELVALEATDVVALVTGLRDAAGESMVPALASFNHHVPTIIVLDLAPGDIRSVLQVVKLDLQEAIFVIHGFESLESAVEQVVSGHGEYSAAPILLRAILPSLSPPARSFFVVAAVGAVQPITVHDVALLLRMGERTLERHLRVSKIPPPHRVLGWCRVLHAAWHLDVLGRTPKEVVDRLQFPSLPALCNLFRHYGVPTPAAVREQQGFPGLKARFMEELKHNRLAS